MSNENKNLVVNVNVEITAATLQAIVKNAKEEAGCDLKGIYRVDTADKVSQTISRFLFEKNFESYVQNRGE